MFRVAGVFVRGWRPRAAASASIHLSTRRRRDCCPGESIPREDGSELEVLACAEARPSDDGGRARPGSGCRPHAGGALGVDPASWEPRAWTGNAMDRLTPGICRRKCSSFRWPTDVPVRAAIGCDPGDYAIRRALAANDSGRGSRRGRTDRGVPQALKRG